MDPLAAITTKTRVLEAEKAAVEAQNEGLQERIREMEGELAAAWKTLAEKEAQLQVCEGRWWCGCVMTHQGSVARYGLAAACAQVLWDVIV